MDSSYGGYSTINVNGVELTYRDPFVRRTDPSPNPNTLPQLTFPAPDRSDTTKGVIAASGSAPIEQPTFWIDFFM